MTYELTILMDLQISGCQYAARLGDVGWKSSNRYTANEYDLPPHFNFDAIELHYGQQTKIAARCNSTAIDLDVHSKNGQERDAQIQYREAVLDELRNDGFQGLVDQSSHENPEGRHLRLRGDYSQADLVDWFQRKSLKPPEIFTMQTGNRLGLPMWDGCPAWSLQDPIFRINNIHEYCEIWFELPNGPALQGGPTTCGPCYVQGKHSCKSIDQSSREEEKKIRVSVHPPDPWVQARLERLWPHRLRDTEKFLRQPEIVARAIHSGQLVFRGLSRQIDPFPEVFEPKTDPFYGV